MVWPVQTHPAQSTGPESKRNSGDGEYFSLDFSFYRTALPETAQAQPRTVFGSPFDDLPSVTFSARVLVTNIPPGVGPERAEAALPSQTKALTGD